MAKDPEQLAHQEWLGYVQPVGLVVSIPALLAAQAHVNRNIIPDHQRFLDCLPRDTHDELIPELRDFAEFTEQVLGWRAGDLEPVPADDARYGSIEVPLPEYNETLRATHVVRELEPKDPQHPWMMLIQLLPTGTALDDAPETHDRTWHAPPQARFERLLRETRVPIGLLCNATQIRIVYAPRGETSGYATFSVSEMSQVAGRPIFAALHMLLCEERLFSLGEKQRLPAILADSRKYQNVVSTQLAEQVLAALYELVRGFQAANDQAKGGLLREVLAENPNHVYQGLLTVLMRLVFVLYAEDRNLLSSDPTFANYYSLTGLFDKLRADDGRYPDTMNQRYGAWAQFLTLFRLIYEGGSHGEFRIPPRHGYLFDPDRYNFLEGRPWKTARRDHAGDVLVPRISDGVIFRVLNNLLILDGERLSYRTLDVEQIGSVYETMMGFDLEVARGRSIALKPKKPHGAPTTINLEALVAVKGADRAKWLKENADQDLTGQALDALKKATTLDELLAALDKKIAKLVTPNVVSKGAIVLQPSDERRKSGSHYTPRSLTEPIVRTTLKPILEQLGAQPAPDQILSLKVCDLAMGSGAFLVETCRQLGDELVKSWHFHKCPPKLPPDEDELLHARRLIAQHCLYGVDKNPMAVDLSKLSLWLATLAKNHPFTFLDHSLRAGDSLVGLSPEQIAAFHWQPPAKDQKDATLFGEPIAAKMKTVTEYRQRILAARDDKPYEQLRQELDVADEALSLARLTGDCVIAAYFSAAKNKDREKKLSQLENQLVTYIGPQGRIDDRQPLAEAAALLRNGDHPVQPFHWQIEFPEVFTVDAKGKPTGGFDAIVGNPPFFAGAWLRPLVGPAYREYLVKEIANGITGLRGTADLCAYFLLRSYALLRNGAACGLVLSSTVAEGDSREVGTAQLVGLGAWIYYVRPAFEWPGAATVEVVMLCYAKNVTTLACTIGETSVDSIDSGLSSGAVEQEPSKLLANSGLICKGHELQGDGFKLSLSEAQEILRVEPHTRRFLRPLITGEDLNESSSQTFRWYVINLCEMELDAAERHVRVMEIIRERVKPERDRYTGSASRDRYLRTYWWKLRGFREEIELFAKTHDSYLACTVHTKYLSFSYLPSDVMATPSIYCILLDSFSGFATLQSRVHEMWAFKYGSTLGDTLRYISGRCFDTFPFPDDNKQDSSLEMSGKAFYEFRKAMMTRRDEGLTDLYNSFHDPDERSPDILKLRELHAAMDWAVLEAYGWYDLAKTATCAFLLDYEDDKDEEDGLTETSPTRRQKRKPWRYRWPDEFRDEVLARLLELNKHRAQQERLTGEAAGAEQTKAAQSARTKSKKSKTGADENASLFDLKQAGGDQ